MSNTYLGNTQGTHRFPRSVDLTRSEIIDYAGRCAVGRDSASNNEGGRDRRDIVRLSEGADLRKDIIAGRKILGEVRASVSALQGTETALVQLQYAIDSAAAAAARTIPATSAAVLTHNGSANNDAKTKFTTAAVAAGKSLSATTTAAYITAYRQLTASDTTAQPATAAGAA